MAGSWLRGIGPFQVLGAAIVSEFANLDASRCISADHDRSPLTLREVRSAPELRRAETEHNASAFVHRDPSPLGTGSLSLTPTRAAALPTPPAERSAACEQSAARGQCSAPRRKARRETCAHAPSQRNQLAVPTKSARSSRRCCQNNATSLSFCTSSRFAGLKTPLNTAAGMT
jgi:hypothetical protein